MSCSVEAWYFLYINLVRSGALVVHVRWKNNKKNVHCDLSLSSHNARQSKTLVHVDCCCCMSNAQNLFELTFNKDGDVVDKQMGFSLLKITFFNRVSCIIQWHLPLLWLNQCSQNSMIHNVLNTCSKLGAGSSPSYPLETVRVIIWISFSTFKFCNNLFCYTSRLSCDGSFWRSNSFIKRLLNFF